MPVTPSPPPNLASDHSHTPISICSFNTSLVSETERSIQPSNTRAERILDFCRTVHVVSLQEVWGPGVDVLTIGLSASHSIPAGLRSTNIPMITSTVNTLAFYFSRTGGLWVAHSKVGGWGDRRDDEEILNSPSRAQPRYPPSKRPIPQLSLPSIPLTVPSLKALSTSPGSSSNSRNSIRALLLDMSEAWGAGRRLLLFNLQLDARKNEKMLLLEK
ncbi:hypothetical protein BDR26DRAFT_57677 [Obelidium mucronatum]|nr:hypothetical protein BDR26DRAFT_57677 [Obelidium mucronatum]